MTTSRPVTLSGIDDVIEQSGRPHLVGSRCTSCDSHVFPPAPSCPRCGSDMESAVLPTDGTVWTYTVQRLAPKPPFVGHDIFEPFAVGYVDLGPILVESPLAGKKPEAWRIGDHVTLEMSSTSAGSRMFQFVPFGRET